MQIAVMLAHQGGWDEILLVLVPILVIGGVLAVAKRRVEAAAALQQADGDNDPVANPMTGAGHDTDGGDGS